MSRQKNVAERVAEEVKNILTEKPQGVGFTELRKALEGKFRGLYAQIPNLPNRWPDVFYKPEKGLYRLVQFREEPESEAAQDRPLQSAARELQESDFYQPFAEHLMGELDECTRAIPLGGNKFGGKWGTPDVIGVLKKRPTDLVDFPIEIVSSEIKLDAGQLITAFGQACAYRLFSHKSYLVIPNTAAEADIGRLVSLCVLSGIGLVIFKPDKDNPDFSIRAHAIRNSPDMFYVNENIRHVANELL